MTLAGSQPLGNSSSGHQTLIHSTFHIREDQTHNVECGDARAEAVGFPRGPVSGLGDCGERLPFTGVGVWQEEQKVRKIMSDVGCVE